MEKIALDVHRRYSFVSVDDGNGRVIAEGRIVHERGAIEAYLRQYQPGTPVAVEATGTWYWVVDEIERAGLEPLLVHARKAKVMLGCVNKTDRLDARGLNRLQRVGTLPTVWIPSGALRDQREVVRTRMWLVSQRTGLKNRIHGMVGRYGLRVPQVSDIFGKRGRQWLDDHLAQLPQYTQAMAGLLLRRLDQVQEEIGVLDAHIGTVCEQTPAVRLLQSIPGIGQVLSVLIALEVGEVSRFAGPEQLASYSGTTPRVHASGGRQRIGALRTDVNRYLKWAFVEAANSVAINCQRRPDRQVSRLYTRLKHKKGHGTAIGAVARHLAEASYWVLTRQETYRDPRWSAVTTTDV